MAILRDQSISVTRLGEIGIVLEGRRGDLEILRLGSGTLNELVEDRWE